MRGDLAEFVQTCAELGVIVGTTKSFISLLECNKTEPSVKTFALIADVLWVTLDYLVTSKDAQRDAAKPWYPRLTSMRETGGTKVDECHLARISNGECSKGSEMPAWNLRNPDGPPEDHINSNCRAVRRWGGGMHIRDSLPRLLTEEDVATALRIGRTTIAPVGQ